VRIDVIVDDAARGSDSAAARSALRAVHAAVLQPTAASAATAAVSAAATAAISAAAAGFRVSVQPAGPVTHARRATTAAVIASLTWQWYAAGDKRVRATESKKSSKWLAEIGRR